MNRLAQAFRDQAQACAALGSPFMCRLCNLLAGIWPLPGALAETCARVTGDPGPAGASLPLRVAGGLHALVLSGLDDDLTAAYPPHVAADTGLRGAVTAALTRHDAFLTDWIASPPQTNEIRRSAVLIAGAQVAAARFGLPIRLSELGASAGLNLNWDRYALDVPGGRIGSGDAVVTFRPDWHGPLPADAAPRIATRRGVDLRPLDTAGEIGRLRLFSYLWPDQPDRLAMTRAALTLPRPAIDTGDAVDWLTHRLRDAPAGQLHLVQNTVAWQYFPARSQARGQQLMSEAGARATATRPLAWLQVESDGDATGGRGASVSLRMWPGGTTATLGRADFHGRWIDWRHS